MTVATDWDGTLVDTKTQEWLPGALDALKTLLREGHRVIVHTCRANWPEGRSSIEGKLESIGLRPAGRKLSVVGKPLADVYVDDRAVRFAGWPATLRDIPLDQAAPARAPRRKQLMVDPSAVAILTGWRA